jgi:hypothetical protein
MNLSRVERKGARRHKGEELRRNNSGAERPVLREFLERSHSPQSLLDLRQSLFQDLHATR